PRRHPAPVASRGAAGRHRISRGVPAVSLPGGAAAMVAVARRRCHLRGAGVSVTGWAGPAPPLPQHDAPGGDRPAAPPEPPVVGAFADPWPRPGRQPPLGGPGSRLHRAVLPPRRDRQGPVRGLPRRLSRRSPGGPHRRPPPPRPDPYPRTP